MLCVRVRWPQRGVGRTDTRARPTVRVRGVRGEVVITSRMSERMGRARRMRARPPHGAVRQMWGLGSHGMPLYASSRLPSCRVACVRECWGGATAGVLI